MNAATAIPTTASRPEPSDDKMPGHWLLAKLGKRVLRPGGVELTRRLLAELAVSSADDIVEFAPGMGATARLALARRPRSYTAVERDQAAAAAVKRILGGENQRCISGNCEETGLPDRSASVVYGEAMLSMQPASVKARIVGEAARLLRPNGRYGIHELCLLPDEADEATREAIQRDLSSGIHVGVRPLTVREWRELLGGAGLRVVAEHTTPMRLLEPSRLVQDEGLLGAVRFAWNVATRAAARRRVLTMRRAFRKHRRHLAAIALVAVKPGEEQ